MFEKNGGRVYEVDVMLWFGILNISVRDRRWVFLESSKVREVICGRDPDNSATDDYGMRRSRRHRLGVDTAMSPMIVTDWCNRRPPLAPLGRRTMIEISGNLSASSFASNMHHQVFEIAELARLISRELVLMHRASAVSLACACRSLEEPALSSLWGFQDSLTTLIGVSPIIMIKGEVCDWLCPSHSHLTLPSGNRARQL